MLCNYIWTTSRNQKLFVYIVFLSRVILVIPGQHFQAKTLIKVIYRYMSKCEISLDSRNQPCQYNNSPRWDWHRSSFTCNTHNCKEEEPLTHTGIHRDHTWPGHQLWNNLGPNGAGQSIKEATPQCWETSKSCTLLTLRHRLSAVRYLNTTYQEYAKSQQDNMGCCQHPQYFIPGSKEANLALGTDNSRGKGDGGRESIKRVKQHFCRERLFGQWIHLLQILTAI